MNKVFEFRRNDNPRGRKVRIEVNLTDDGVFTASCGGPTLYWGQCLDKAQKELNIKNPIFKEIIRLWKLYHLNNMHAGDRVQEEVLKQCKDTDYKARCKFLAERNLLVHNGYRYGTDWLKYDIPTDDLNKIKELLK